MDYQNIVNVLAVIISHCFPLTLIFGITAKLCNLAFDFIFNKKIEM